jgi:hypothetical protein
MALHYCKFLLEAYLLFPNVIIVIFSSFSDSITDFFATFAKNSFFMILSENIRELLKQKSGLALRLPSEAEQLVLDIESNTREHIGVNTMKRLLGMIADEREPRATTLDVIARYLGYAHWGTLSAVEGKSNSSFSASEGELRSSELPSGAWVEVNYHPGRHVVLRHVSGSRFLVEKSEKSKLFEGDSVDVDYFIQGYPIYVRQVVRNGINLGTFTAGKMAGISYSVVENRK